MKQPKNNFFFLILLIFKYYMTTATNNKYNAPALDKGLDIIEFLSKEGVPLTQLEIAQGIQRTPSEIYRMLVCLEERGYLIRGSNAGKYRLSLKMYNLSHTHTPFDELKRVSHYPMQSLSEITRQSCHLSIMDKDQLLIIAQMRSPNAVSLSIEEGTHFPISKTTSGRVMLSLYSDEKIKEILTRDAFFPKWSKKEQTAFLASIEQTKTDGYRWSHSTMTSGITDIAVAIGLPETNFTAVLAVSVFSSSLESELKIEKIVQELKNTQLEINNLIGA